LKTAVIGPISEVIYSNKINSKNFTYRVLPQVVLNVPVALFLPKYHYLTNEIERCVNILHAAGLIEFWIAEHLDEKYLKPKIEDASPKVLELEHLKGIFYVWLGGCTISILIFLIEIARHNCMRRKFTN
jgi:hypothetical protein